MNIKRFLFITFIIFTLFACDEKAIEILSVDSQVDYYYYCCFDSDVTIFDGMDLKNGKKILDYNQNKGKAFAKYNKINYQDINYDYKVKYKEILSIFGLDKFTQDVVFPEKKVTKEREKLDKTLLPTFSNRDKSVKPSQTVQNIPDDRQPNYDRLYNGKLDSMLAGQELSEQNVQKQQSVVKENTKSDKENKAKIENLANNDDEIITIDQTVDQQMRASYIFEPKRIDELNFYLEMFSQSLHDELLSRFSDYSLNLKDDFQSATEADTMLLFKIVKYRPGEFNLINNINTNVTIEMTIVNKRYGVNQTFVQNFDCEASAFYPNEKARLIDISEKLVKSLAKKLHRLHVKTSKSEEKEQKNEETVIVDVTTDENVVPINDKLKK